MFSLQKKTAVITGGGSGIGKAVAEVFAQQGAEVFILDLNQSTADDAAKAIHAKGGKAYAMAVNVADQKQVKDTVAAIAQQAGRIDILVNSAGVSHIGKLDNTGEEDFDRVFQVNVKGVYNTMLAVIHQMKAQGGGVILNLASIASSVGLPDRFAYSMSKGAVLTMTLSVAKDYLKDNIRCNCISPARVHTSFVDNFLAKNYPGQEKEMFEKLSKTQPIGRMGKPEEVASLALYLCSDEASFVTGTDYPLDGGFIRLNN
ncbi:SDR family NAD(P)-dependent oxidoreductase [Ohtaekwangia koreensis]|uniref:NAD(P)-dependent dehydrogenase, short-chain alcohol dehydrogenase family n=1 Tax=Ohtaekwangia koreensis TaxID=688867 RepID=A0A1T5MF89_9BACT|nr:SDR family oxidoreductase [Ohtaekwangia koreensis]SKC86815.1 NAD(P)-dependent dehydrogenase, short-chain alcohol dehydrogenase family [Ohtaekwangia koreensis]